MCLGPGLLGFVCSGALAWLTGVDAAFERQLGGGCEVLG